MAKATAAQLRNLAKGRAKLAKMRRAGKKVVRKKRTVRPRGRRRRNPEGLSHEAWELILWGENSSAPWIRNQYDSILKNIARKINSGIYQPEKAPQLWKYWFDSIAKDYEKEFGSGRGYGPFTATIRREAAAYYAPREYASILNNEYDHVTGPVATGSKKKKKKTRRKVKRKTSAQMFTPRKNPARGNFMTARNVLRTGRTTNPVRPLTGKKRMTYLIRQRLADNKLGKYYDGKGWTAKPAEAAGWTNKKRALVVAKAVADRIGKPVALFGTVR